MFKILLSFASKHESELINKKLSTFWHKNKKNAFKSIKGSTYGIIKKNKAQSKYDKQNWI